MNIIGIAGRNEDGSSIGSGKDTAADILVDRFGFTKMGFADALKRTVKQLWPLFTEESLWGPSHLRGTAFPEYGGLTARRACQFVGTEIGRELDPYIWIRKAREVWVDLSHGNCSYHRTRGIYPSDAPPPAGVVVADTRFENEGDAIHEDRGRIWLVDRARGLVNQTANHRSEAGLPGRLIDGIIRNDRDLESFQETVEQFAEIAGFKMVQR